MADVNGALSSLNDTPMGDRLVISVFGRRNVGKSSLVNAITGQEVSVTSSVAGTTTDPVLKAMELLPVGPVVFVDTAGLDDEGELGVLRIERTHEMLHQTQLALVVTTAEEGLGEVETGILDELGRRDVARLVVLNKRDVSYDAPSFAEELRRRIGVPVLPVSATTGEGVAELRRAIGSTARFDDAELGLVGGLVGSGDVAVLVTPIDKAAPKGRLILPQQQVIRDVLEVDGIAVVTKEHELRHALESLGRRPSVVITDSQAFLKVAADTPEDVPMTSFSILFARQKGDLAAMVRGVGRIECLEPGSRVLVCEGCAVRRHRHREDSPLDPSDGRRGHPLRPGLGRAISFRCQRL